MNASFEPHMLPYDYTWEKLHQAFLCLLGTWPYAARLEASLEQRAVSGTASIHC